MPTPIDPNTEILRVNLAERIQQIADRASLLGQVRQSVNEEERRIVDETQVKQTEQKSEQVETELKRRQPFMGRRRRKVEKESTSTDEGSSKDEGEEEGKEGSHLDIKI